MARRSEESKQRRREYIAQWQRDNPELRALYDRRSSLKRKYGITLEQFDAMSAAQNHACAICGSQEPLCVDHDHETGVIRGLLCGRCNKGIGLLGDSLEGLERAVRYLGT